MSASGMRCCSYCVVKETRVSVTGAAAVKVAGAMGAEEKEEFAPFPKSRRAGAKKKRGACSGIEDIRELEGCQSLFESSDDESGEEVQVAAARSGGGVGTGGWRDALEPVLCLSHDSLQAEVCVSGSGLG